MFGSVVLRCEGTPLTGPVCPEYSGDSSVQRSFSASNRRVRVILTGREAPALLQRQRALTAVFHVLVGSRQSKTDLSRAYRRRHRACRSCHHRRQRLITDAEKPGAAITCSNLVDEFPGETRLVPAVSRRQAA